jgi:Na+(H+)/acetate symporter ActP
MALGLLFKNFNASFLVGWAFNVAASANVTGWRLVPGNTSAATEAALAAWVAAYGPVSILVDAMTQLWWTYTGGIMTGCCNV